MRGCALPAVINPPPLLSIQLMKGNITCLEFYLFSNIENFKVASFTKRTQKSNILFDINTN